MLRKLVQNFSIKIKFPNKKNTLFFNKFYGKNGFKRDVNAAKSFDILATRLNTLHNYFNNSIIFQSVFN